MSQARARTTAARKSSENNNRFSAHPRIAALRAATASGIELLEYIAPGDGRLSLWMSMPMTFYAGTSKKPVVGTALAQISSGLVET
jgi:hypothetical protein